MPPACVSFDYASQYAEARREIAEWLKEGSLKRRFHVVQGLHNAPQALNLLFTGGNTGKLYVLFSHISIDSGLTRWPGLSKYLKQRRSYNVFRIRKEILCYLNRRHTSRM